LFLLLNDEIEIYCPLVIYIVDNSNTSMVRLASIEHDGQTKFVAQIIKKQQQGDEGYTHYCDLTTAVASNIKEFFLLEKEAGLERVQQAIADETNHIMADDDTVRLLAPMDGSLCGKFLCIGMNYKDHCTEQNIPVPTEPLIFTKFGDCIIGPNEPVVKDDHVNKLDYEVELGVVIGKTVPRFLDDSADDDLRQYIGGYTVIHDVSARDWQLGKNVNGGQWILGKAMDGYAPMGPVIVTPDEFAQPAGLRCRVNGETLQDSSTSQMVFDVATLLRYLSKFMTLRPGDVIATGTPPGVGCFRKPTPQWLVPGDVVECEIDGIGTLTNPVVSPSEQRVPPAVSNHGPLAGKICIVTGGVQGIGYGIVKRLGKDGARQITLVDIVDKDVGAKACARLLQEEHSGCAYAYEQCDVTNYEEVKQCWDRIAASSTGGRIDILVQAAGIVGETNIGTEDVDPQNFQQVMNVNVQGIFHGCKAVLPHMKKSKSKGGFGRIVNIASIAGKEGNAGMLAYSTSKAAVIGLTKTLGKELAATSGITCNAIAPAVVRTEMVAAMPPAQVKYMTDKIPMQRCGTIEEIAAVVAFMVSPEASFTTGFCFDATGGRAVY